MLLYKFIGTAVLILAISLSAKASLTEEEVKLRDEVLHDFKEVQDTGSLTPRLFGVLDQISLPSIFTMLPTKISVYDSTICVACRSVIDALLRYYESRKTPEELRDLVYTMCTNLQIQPPNVCAGVIDLNLDTLIYILDNTEGISSSRICAIILQGSGCTTDDPILEWTVDADLGKKPQKEKTISTKAKAGEPLYVVQLTDIHHDPGYQPSGNAQCGEPMCCRNVQGDPENPEAAAGYWGDYRLCDTPWHTFQDTLNQIKATHQQVDYIYMTGDIIDHAVWDTSISKNTETITKILEQLKSEFPDVPVYPILGNHEPSPLNVYSPNFIVEEKVSTQWLYDLIAEQWSAWLPEDTKPTILKGGFYTALARPGFRIIGLNNNVCYTFNWWLIHAPKDPDDQLKWLAETLLEAENAGEKVHILGHVPSGDGSCQKTWSREFKRIVDRFEDTITAHFYGHTHNDQLYLYYNKDEPTRANNVAFNGGSLTSYSDLNSNYKIYEMDSESFNIVDYESWIFNLTEANLNTVSTNWLKLYSFKEAYGVESMSLEDLDRLTHQMAINKSLIEAYAKYYVKYGDTSLANGCDADCQKSRLCDIVQTEVGDRTQCDKLLEEYDASR